MKTNTKNTVLILSLHLAVMACSKVETNDMMFKQAISTEEQSMAQPVPGASDSSQEPEKLPEQEQQEGSSVVIISNPDSSSVSTPDSSSVSSPDSSSVSTPDSSSVSTPDSSSVSTPDSSSVSTPDSSAPVYVPFADGDIPVCKLDIDSNGAGSASSFAIASASKAELMGSALAGFEDLSDAELANMRSAVDKMVSGDGVLVLKDGDKFKKNSLVNGKALIVIDGNSKVSIDINGLGKDAKVYLMSVSSDHNTVCVRVNGSTNSSKVALSANGDEKFVTRALLDFKGSGSNQIIMNVKGGHQTGSSFVNNGLKDSKLSMNTEGLNDTFASLNGNQIQGGELDLRLKGKNDAGIGIDVIGINDARVHMELEGEDRVSSIVKGSLTSNEIDGWLKYKTEGSLPASLEDYITLMPAP